MSRYLRRTRRRKPLYQPGAVYCSCGRPSQYQEYMDGSTLCPDCRAARAQREPERDE